MKLAIVGGRDFNDYCLLSDILYDYFDKFILEIISGGAKGADFLGKRYAENHGISYIDFPACWDKYGKSAGFKRNQTIVDACDMVLAFWDGKSKGTQDTINKAKKAKKPTFIVYY
jgi:hypothetical protein